MRRFGANKRCQSVIQGLFSGCDFFEIESAGDEGIVDYSPFSPQRSDGSTPSSLYMESCECFLLINVCLIPNMFIKWS